MVSLVLADLESILRPVLPDMKQRSPYNPNSKMRSPLMPKSKTAIAPHLPFKMRSPLDFSVKMVTAITSLTSPARLNHYEKIHFIPVRFWFNYCHQ